MSAKRKTAKDQTITVSEFKQWLSGVEDMQQAGWVPNDEQWKKIRSKIAALSDEVFEEVVAAPIQAVVPQHYPQQYPQYVPAPPMPHARHPQTSLGDELFIPKPDASDAVFDQSMNLSAPGVTQFG